MSGIRYLVLILLFLIPAGPALALGEVTVAILPNERGGFTLRANNLDNVTAGEIRIFYETAGPATPRVSAVGLGAKANLQTVSDSGTIVIRLTSPQPLRGSGYLATVELAAPEWGVGRVTHLSAWLVNDKGEGDSVRTIIKNHPTGADKPVPVSTNAKPRSKIPSGRTPSVETPPGTATPGADSGKTVLIAKADSGLSGRGGDPPLRRLESVLDRFRSYAGELTPAARSALFLPAGADLFRQKPAVLISDGVAEVQVTIGPIGEGEEAKYFIISGGHFSYLQKGAPGEWVLGLVPERGTLAASVTLRTTKELVEYPLIVAPPLELFRAGERGEDPTLIEYVTLANERALRNPAAGTNPESTLLPDLH